MKITKDQIGNLIWIAVILLILFTPIGFHIKVFTGKLFSQSADTIEVDERQTLENYAWKLTDANGYSRNFDAFAGKVVLVNFWATWCPPCVAEMPSLARLYEAYEDKVIFAFVANDEKEKVNRFLTNKGYQLPIYYEVSAPPELLRSSSIPATYIISKSGEVVVREIGAAKWDTQTTRDLLDQLLQE